MILEAIEFLLDRTTVNTDVGMTLSPAWQPVSEVQTMSLLMELWARMT